MILQTLQISPGADMGPQPDQRYFTIMLARGRLPTFERMDLNAQKKYLNSPYSHRNNLHSNFYRRKIDIKIITIQNGSHLNCQFRGETLKNVDSSRNF